MTDDVSGWYIIPENHVGPLCPTSKHVKVVRADDLTKWKSRCASLTAEVVCLRLALDAIPGKRAAYYINDFEKYWIEANRIKAEREKSIESPQCVSVSLHDSTHERNSLIQPLSDQHQGAESPEEL